MSDPFDVLAGHDDALSPRPEFATELRSRIEMLLGVPTISAPARRTHMTTTSSIPYLTVHDAAAALDFYAAAFGAVEVMRVVMDAETGSIGHAEFRIGTATFYLSDEFPEMGVVSPQTLGGTSVALHLQVTDVDAAFAAAVAAGARAVAEPADQPHGARHGTLVDSFGHRWMLSQQIENVSLATYADRLAGSGATVVAGPDSRRRAGGGIWAALNFADAPAGIRFMVDVLGFEEQLVVPGAEPGVIEHSQFRWPEGGVVQAATANRQGNMFSARPTGTESLYVITADPMAVHRRCVAARAEIAHEPESPEYDPDGLVFTVRDPEGNLWSFGTYAGED